MQAVNRSFYGNGKAKNALRESHDVFCEVLHRKLASNTILISKSNKGDFVKKNINNQLINTQYFQVLKHMSFNNLEKQKTSQALLKKDQIEKYKQLEAMNRLNRQSYHRYQREKDE